MTKLDWTIQQQAKDKQHAVLLEASLEGIRKQLQSLGKQYNKAFSELRNGRVAVTYVHSTILSRNAQDVPEQRPHNSDNVGQTEGPASQESR